MRLLMVALASMAVLGAGCSGTPALVDDSSVDVDDADGKADGVARPLGTYRKASGSPDNFVLAVKSDKTFFRLYYGAEARGTYKFTTSGSTRYIRFYDGAGALIDRWAYSLESTGLTLRRAGDAYSYEYLRPSAASWCALSADCDLQGIAPECEGSFSCELDVCHFTCDEARPCETAGGECVPELQDSCAGGYVERDAAPFSCSTAGLVCCVMPAHIVYSTTGDPVADTLHAARHVEVDYDLERLFKDHPECAEQTPYGDIREVQMGIKVNDDPGRVGYYVPVAASSATSYYSPRLQNVILLPADTTTLTLWFSCGGPLYDWAYDNNGGADYTFAVVPPEP